MKYLLLRFTVLNHVIITKSMVVLPRAWVTLASFLRLSSSSSTSD